MSLFVQPELHSIEFVIKALKNGEFVRGDDFGRLSYQDGVYVQKGFDDDILESELEYFLLTCGFEFKFE